MIWAGWIPFRASLMAMRRTSWIDQRINDGAVVPWSLPRFGASFFWAMADWRDGGSPPSWRRRASYMTMPPVPGSALIVIEPELVLGGLKTILDRPAMTLDRYQRFERCSRWTPGGKEGEIAIGDVATNQ